MHDAFSKTKRIIYEFWSYEKVFFDFCLHKRSVYPEL